MKKIIPLAILSLVIVSIAATASAEKLKLKHTHGNILMSDRFSMYKVDPDTGKQTLLSSGFSYNFGIAVDSKGTIYATNITFSSGQVLKVDPETGAHTVVSEGNYLTNGNPKAIAIDKNDQIWVTTDAGLVKIDPATGKQTLVDPIPVPGAEFWGVATVK